MLVWCLSVCVGIFVHCDLWFCVCMCGVCEFYVCGCVSVSLWNVCMMFCVCLFGLCYFDSSFVRFLRFIVWYVSIFVCERCVFCGVCAACVCVCVYNLCCVVCVGYVLCVSVCVCVNCVCGI